MVLNPHIAFDTFLPVSSMNLAGFQTDRIDGLRPEKIEYVEILAAKKYFGHKTSVYYTAKNFKIKF